MNLQDFILIVIICVSLFGNLYQFKTPKIKESSTDLSQFRRDLERYNTAIVKVTVIDPQDIYLKSPRDS